MLEEAKKVPGTSAGFIAGGQVRELRVLIDPARLKAYGLTPLQVAGVIRGENRALPTGRFDSRNRSFLVETGRFIRSREDLESLVVGVNEQRPVYLRQVAEVTDGPGESTQYVWFGEGAGAAAVPHPSLLTPDEEPAVTVAVAKQGGTNAVTVASEVIKKVESLKSVTIPTDVRVTVTRDYGETAREKADELLWHLLIAVAAVVAFLGVALGVRPAMVVSLAIPLTLALTLFTSMLIGYTINRVTLFALIFSIGILVDDAIVVVENTYRHLTRRLRPHREASIHAVDEVGNPTILATFTVIAALLPMAFVSGLMGPYMRPIPVNASIAMFFSLLVAFVVIPWFCQTCYRPGATVAGVDHEGDEQGLTARLYRRLLTPLLAPLGFPADLLPLVLVRPLSGSASIGLFTELVQRLGPDDIVVRMAGTIFGSTETTFYVIAVYFGAVAIRRTRHAIAAGLTADFVGVVASVIICRLMFG